MTRRSHPRAKRVFDVVIGIPSLVIALPVMGAVAASIRITMGRPVLFRQTRTGLHGATFGILKFRTMSDARDEEGHLLPDGDRLTRLGRFLRRGHLDELPELFNVLKGDMSLVGPRPLLPRYIDRYTPEQRRRHDVRPGMTGWTQVNGNNALTWEQKLAFDVWYVENHTILLDVSILFRTIWKVLSGKGVRSPGSATAEEFVGSSGIPAPADDESVGAQG
jgi:sugar transferase EpsL